MKFGKPTIYTILLFLLGIMVAYWIHSKKGETPKPEEVLTTPLEVATIEQSGAAETTNAEVTQPQYSQQNPPPRSLDPFTKHDDFEVILKSSQNKQDFDFKFEQGNAPSYSIENGTINFELVGRLLTKADLENIAYLTVEIYNNDQISFTRRKTLHRFDLAFVRDKMEQSANQKIRYDFDLHRSIAVAPGLYYYTIIPAGRNRVLYAGKFTAK